MASWIAYDCKPELKRPVLIEGLPGVGNVGKLAADLMSRKLESERMARIYSEDLPPQVVLDENCIAEPASCELRYVSIPDGPDLVFMLGDFQGTSPSGQYRLSEDAFRIVLPYDPSMIVTLGGYGTGQLSVAPRVLGAVSDERLKPKAEEAGIGFYPGEPQGGIVGAAAMILGFGKMYGIDSLCIMGETSGYIVDYRSARNVLNALCALLGVYVDSSEFQASIDQIEAIGEASSSEPSGDVPEDLTYIR